MTPAGRARLLALGAFALGGAVVLYSGIGLGGVFGGLARRAPLIALDAIDATGFLAGVGVVLIGIVASLPPGVAVAARRGRSLPTIPRAAGPLLIAAAVLIVASPIAASVARAVVASRAADRGYVRCPRTAWPRKQPDRWALPTGPGCPHGSSP